MEAHERRAKMSKSIKTIFPQTQDGCCAVCKEEITDNRKRRYCSDHCKQVAYAAANYFRWQSVRNRVLDRRENVCKRCGYDPDEHEQELEELSEKIQSEYDAVNNVYTERSRTLEVDHIKPVAKGGKVFDFDNLQILCDKCNRQKSDRWNGKKDLDDFMEMQEEGVDSVKRSDTDE